MITEKKLDGIRNGDRMDRQEIIDTISAALKVVRAAQTVDLYFKALCEQWAANDGRLVSETGIVLEGSTSINELCERAAMEISTSLAPFEEGDTQEPSTVLPGSVDK